MLPTLSRHRRARTRKWKRNAITLHSVQYRREGKRFLKYHERGRVEGRKRGREEGRETKGREEEKEKGKEEEVFYCHHHSDLQLLNNNHTNIELIYGGTRKVLASFPGHSQRLGRCYNCNLLRPLRYLHAYA